MRSNLWNIAVKRGDISSKLQNTNNNILIATTIIVKKLNLSTYFIQLYTHTQTKYN